jgi:outer membrane protein TolC
LLSLSFAGCVSKELLVWPATPPGAGTLGAAAPAGGNLVPVPLPDRPGDVRAAFPPALASRVLGEATGREGGEAASTTPTPPSNEAKRDEKVGTVMTSADPSIPVVPSPPVVPPAPMEYPIDLTTALRLAEVENPEIAVTRVRIREALAVLQGARVLAIPTLNAGANYHGHTGNLQRSSGTILNLSEQSLYFGGGARTVAAESIGIPAVNIVSPLADVIFEPLAARQDVDRAQFDYRAAANSILLEVATLHFDLIEAEAGLELYRETEAEAREVARLTSVYEETGQGTKADADRAATTALLFRRRVQRGEEEVAVASTRLAHRLHLDPVVRMRPVVPRIGPITLIDPSTPVEELVRVALQRRPELGARAAALGVARTRFRQELLRPLLPMAWVGYSGGAFGGGSNLVPPLVGNFGGRNDFDVRLYWTLQNMGLGNLAITRTRRAEVGVAMGEQSRAINLVRREVGASLGEVIPARLQIGVTGRQLATAEAGFREDLDRIRGTIGLPIEVTNSLELLAQARQNHLRAILNYNRAQFRLFVSLGSPPPLDRPPTEPLPPAPIAAPPTPLPSESTASFLHDDSTPMLREVGPPALDPTVATRPAVPPVLPPPTVPR